MAKKRSSRRTSSRSPRAGAVPVSSPRGRGGPARTPVIVTFKPKDQRRDKTDKVQIVMDSISSRVQVFDVTSPPAGVARRKRSPSMSTSTKRLSFRSR